jgi:hypothetical protein
MPAARGTTAGLGGLPADVVAAAIAAQAEARRARAREHHASRVLTLVGLAVVVLLLGTAAAVIPLALAVAAAAGLGALLVAQVRTAHGPAPVADTPTEAGGADPLLGPGLVVLGAAPTVGAGRPAFACGLEEA